MASISQQMNPVDRVAFSLFLLIARPTLTALLARPGRIARRMGDVESDLQVPS
jgi:hypothetical protein